MTKAYKKLLEAKAAHEVFMQRMKEVEDLMEQEAAPAKKSAGNRKSRAVRNAEIEAEMRAKMHRQPRPAA